MPRGNCSVDSKVKAVVALGNPDRGDDGVAHRVLASLSSPEGADLFPSLKTGMDLVLSLLGYEKVLVIDADPSRTPGEVALFRLEEENMGGHYRHGLGIAEACAFLKRAGFPLPQVWILAIGVDPKTPFARGLSPEVERAVSRAKEVAEAWLRS